MYYKKKGKFQKGTWNDIIIGADTETSKGHEITKDTQANHVCAWTISIRAYHANIVTLYGTRPSEMMQAFGKIRDALKGDIFYVYFHNAAYDWFFLRRFFYAYFGYPTKELNTKPHYPIMLGFENGMIIKDSLILAGCKLEKWANDLNVNHKKAVGSWDYDAIRDQGEKFSRSELHYIENDTLALVECLDAMCITLNKNISTIPYTATGIPRAEVRERGKDNNAHRDFLRVANDFEQQVKMKNLYHGGYSHGNRYYLQEDLTDGITKGADFVSSYPFCLLAYKYPGKFTPLERSVDVDYILRNNEKYAFIFKASFVNIRLKDPYMPMPALQASKCDQSINLRVDNGRVLRAGYVTLYICDIDLEVIASMYTWDSCGCTEVEYSKKKYLPRWFTDYVYELFEAKCRLKKTKKEDPVNYALAKARLNSLYGLCVQSPIRQNFIEVTEPGMYKIDQEGHLAWYDSGEYRTDFDTDLRKEYERFLKSPNSVLPFQYGVYCTAYAFRNLFLLGDCVNKYYTEDGNLAFPPRWFYSDTDSCYSDDWNMDKVREYNENCKKLLETNGYGPVRMDNKEYWLGIAEMDSDSEYSEFRVLGSKRYCGRSTEDKQLHITVAGVPKKGAVCLKDDISNFSKGFIFEGTKTGKLAHFYIFAQDIYKDQFGNEIGDSIDLQPCDYQLDAVDKVEFLFTDDFCMEYYGEENADQYDK